MERRRHRRFDLTQLVELGFGRERFIHAEGVDISRSGIRCNTTEELELSSTLVVYLAMELDGDATEPLSAEAVVRRCDPLEEAGYDVGMEFSLLDSYAEKRLNGFLENIAPA